jgi:7-carboxy-7-deazaguanine synthase
VRYVSWLRRGIPSVCIEIETNGTISPHPYLAFLVQWNCSPKLASSGVPKEKRFILEALQQFSSRDKSIFKFVVTTWKDWAEIEQDFLPLIDKKKVWLMPGASNIEELLERNKRVSEIALSAHVNFSSRLQVEIWNQTTGV